MENYYLNIGKLNDFQKNLISTTATKILKDDVSTVKSNTESFPPAANFLDSENLDVPKSIFEFIMQLLDKNSKANKLIVRDVIARIKSLTFKRPVLLALKA